MLFLDGVGIGRDDGQTNPFFVARLSTLRSLLGGNLPSKSHSHYGGSQITLMPLDPNLGVEGLPQSGTGQTALFTGVNGAQFVGKHFGPYPYSTLRPVIQERNIFRQLLDAKKSVHFANAYPQRFFDYVKKNPSRLTVTTLSCMMSGVPLLGIEELAGGKAISADITGEGWPRLGYPELQTITAQEAGQRLARLSAEHDFVLFEYWHTDKAGHARDMHEAVHALEIFDGFLDGVVQALDTSETLLFITSDHGNIEDLSTKAHTRNMVPAISYGYRHDEIAQKLGTNAAGSADLTGVTPTLVDAIIT